MRTADSCSNWLCRVEQDLPKRLLAYERISRVLLRQRFARTVFSRAEVGRDMFGEGGDAAVVLRPSDCGDDTGDS
jgi:hypothetical protein